MMRWIVLFVAALGLIACDKQAPAGDPHAAFESLSVDQVEQLARDGKCLPVDANNAEIRDQYGVVPGALLLSSYDEYAPDELPADKARPLVFYCGYETCTAAPTAAKIAVEAGYRDVKVMKAGIRGWAKAGKKVDRPSS